MKKRILLVSASLLALLILLGAALLANAAFGNPVSYQLAANAAEKHITEHYEALDLSIERVSYSFKDGLYHAYVSAPDSLDCHFTLSFDPWGNLRADSYTQLVTSGWNTARRIEDDYRSRVFALLESDAFPYTADIGHGEIVFASAEYRGDPSVPSYALFTDTLTLDGIYDTNEIAAASGRIVLYPENETVSHERLAEIVLDVKRIFDAAELRFYALNLVLEAPNGDRVEVLEMRYADIYEEGMLDRVIASDEAAKAYYAEQDAEKLKDLPANGD